MIPETLRLADYGLGRDDRARQRQPVAIRLGPRFYDWQLSQSGEESWHEWHLHARNLLGPVEQICCQASHTGIVQSRWLGDCSPINAGKILKWSLGGGHSFKGVESNLGQVPPPSAATAQAELLSLRQGNLFE